ncbi:hypothetical protein CBS9595_002980 [Malassezia furfur]|nr:hypothetical protein CBS9595_002980 [Malassezia furfur]
MLATRYSLGLVDLRPHRDAAHRPIGRAPKPGPAMYHIEQSLPPTIRNDTLSLLRAGAPMYPPPPPSRIPNTNTIELLILIPLCLVCAALVYVALAYVFTRRTRRPTLPLTTPIATPDVLLQCEREWQVLRRAMLRGAQHTRQRVAWALRVAHYGVRHALMRLAR